MDFSDVDNASGEVGGEVQEVESKDSDFGDGDGVNDFDETYNEMNSGNETMEYSKRLQESCPDDLSSHYPDPVGQRYLRFHEVSTGCVHGNLSLQPWIPGCFVPAFHTISADLQAVCSAESYPQNGFLWIFLPEERYAAYQSRYQRFYSVLHLHDHNR